MTTLLAIAYGLHTTKAPVLPSNAEASAAKPSTVGLPIPTVAFVLFELGADLVRDRPTDEWTIPVTQPIKTAT